MTTFVDFAPSTAQAFQFQAALDGAQHTVIVTWSLFGARYYVNVYALDGTRVVSRALIGSATGLELQGLSWSGGKATATTRLPHGYKVGRSIALTISGAFPAAYNGLVEVLVTGPSTFTWPLTDDPGAATAFGAASYDVSMVAGYFKSTLVYRAPSQQFEVAP